MKKVLITGAEGNIGSSVRALLADRYEIHALTREPVAGLESFVADLGGDLNALLPAFAGMDAVVHLAGSSGMQHPWEAVLHNNIVGTYNVFEAARQQGVKQIVYASSNHAVGMYELDRMPELYRPRAGLELDHLMPVRPDSLYGVSKVFGEGLARYYSDKFGISIYCLRIGTARLDDSPNSDAAAKGQAWLPLPEEANLRRMASTWQSKRDLADEIDACLQAEDVKFDIFYGVSNNPFRFWDIEHVRAVIGWHPKDGAPDPTARP
jgi:NAD+ dependent glucose-6-phosphate dehydrogenase